MSEFLWSILAKFLAKPKMVRWLIRRARRTPYTHITGRDGTVYMERYWLFNPYPEKESQRGKCWQFPISIRLHHIRREDQDRHLHDHPWNARTIILDGWYIEERDERPYKILWDFEIVRCRYIRAAGNTALLNHGEFHRITSVNHEGVWTMFITGRYRGTWGFKVGGFKIPWRKYLGIEEEAS